LKKISRRQKGGADYENGAQKPEDEDVERRGADPKRKLDLKVSERDLRNNG